MKMRSLDVRLLGRWVVATAASFPWVWICSYWWLVVAGWLKIGAPPKPYMGPPRLYYINENEFVRPRSLELPYGLFSLCTLALPLLMLAYPAMHFAYILMKDGGAKSFLGLSQRSAVMAVYGAGLLTCALLIGDPWGFTSWILD